MPSTTPDLITNSSPRRAVVEGVVAVVVLTTLVGGVAAALVWSVVRVAGTLVP